MTDLVRPVAGQSLLDSDGAGTTSTSLIDAAFDVIETNEDALLVRTSPHIVTTDQYTDQPEVELNDGTSLTGWHVIQPDAAELTPVLVTISGRTAVQAYLKGASGDFTPSLYVNLTEIGYPTGIDVGGGETIAVDILLSQTVAISPFYNAFVRYAVTLADGVDMTGTIVQNTFEQNQIEGNLLNTWYTILVPVGALTNIKSIGIKKCISTGTGTARARWSLTNVEKREVTPLDQAYASQASVAVLVPPSYPSVGEQLPIFPDPLKAIVDFRPDHAFISGFGGFKNTREWQLDETGETDVTDALQAVIDSLSPGDTLVMPPTAIYRIDAGITFSVPNVTVDGNGAALMSAYPDELGLYDGVNKVASHVNRRVRFDAGAAGMTFKRMRIFGAHITPQLGSTWTTAAGAPVVVGTTIQLDAQNEAISFNNIPGRDWLGRTRQDLVLSDTTQVPSDTTVTVTDDDGVVLLTQSLTLTSTPTVYTIYATPRNIFSSQTIKLTKATATANVITLTQMRTFNNCYTGWIGSIYEFAHGIAVGADNLTIEDVTLEGVVGDGIWIENGLPTTGVQNCTVRRVMVRGSGRQGTAPCGGRNHLYEDFYSLYGARHGVDIEPESPTTSAVDGMIWRNIYIWKPNGPPAFQDGVSGQGWARCRNINVDGLYVWANGGALGGGFMDSSFRNMQFKCTTTGTPVSEIFGRNVTWDDVQMEGVIQIGSSAATTGTDENLVVYNQTGFNVKNVLFTKQVNGEPYLTTTASGVAAHLENIRVSDKLTLDQTYAVSGFQILADTTYSGIDLAPHRALLPNSYPGVAIGQPWFPAGLDMQTRGINRVGYLSGGTVKGNNFGRFQASVVAASTTAAVLFPVKTGYPNVASTVLSSSTMTGVLTAGTYHYRLAARNRYGGPVVATADQSVTLSTGTAVNILMDGIYNVAAGIQIDGVTIYRGPVGGASGNYTLRYDVVPTADLWAMGGGGTGTNKRISLTDLGTTIVRTTANTSFFQSYTFPYTGVAGVYTPVDETGYEADTNYAVFIEPSWHTTWKVSSRRRDGFDLEFGIPCPTGGGTVSWMIARF